MTRSGIGNNNLRTLFFSFITVLSSVKQFGSVCIVFRIIYHICHVFIVIYKDNCMTRSGIGPATLAQNRDMVVNYEMYNKVRTLFLSFVTVLSSVKQFGSSSLPIHQSNHSYYINTAVFWLADWQSWATKLFHWTLQLMFWCYRLLWGYVLI